LANITFDRIQVFLLNNLFNDQTNGGLT